jgi:hypothetical protein
MNTHTLNYIMFIGQILITDIHRELRDDVILKDIEDLDSILNDTPTKTYLAAGFTRSIPLWNPFKTY